MNKSPFLGHVKDAVPPPHRSHLVVWESTSAERAQALGMQLVSGGLFGLGGLASVSASAQGFLGGDVKAAASWSTQALAGETNGWKTRRAVSVG